MEFREGKICKNVHKVTSFGTTLVKMFSCESVDRTYLNQVITVKCCYRSQSEHADRQVMNLSSHRYYANMSRRVINSLFYLKLQNMLFKLQNIMLFEILNMIRVSREVTMRYTDGE